MTGRSELLRRFADGPRLLADALRSVEPETRTGEGGWTVREVVHHLADTEVIAAGRLRRLLSEQRPHIGGFDQDELARAMHYERPLGVAVDMFDAIVRDGVEVLTALADHEWARDATHDDYPVYNVDFWLERRVIHVEEHTAQILQAAR